MQFLMAGEAAFGGEKPLTLLTRVSFFPFMEMSMLLEVSFLTEGFLTFTALEMFFFNMNLHMID